MKTTKTLFVTAKYGSLIFSEHAYPYDPFNHSFQEESCKQSIIRQIVKAGRSEMLDAFMWTIEII